MCAEGNPDNSLTDANIPPTPEHYAKVLPSSEILHHMVDVHCHPTDTEISTDVIDSLEIRVCAMSTRRTDQGKVADLARAYPSKVIPAFGYHPWFSHLISIEPISDSPEAKNEHYRQMFMPPGSKLSSKPENKDALDRLLRDLPHPFILEDIVSDLRKNIAEFLDLHRGDPAKYPKPLLGEVGLDQSFRVPFGTSTESDLAHVSGGSRLSPFFVPVDHQRRILEAQIDLAVEMGVNVSLHSVKSPAPTQAILKTMIERHGPQFDAISVDMHSIGVSVDTWRDIERRYPNVYMSLSTAINFRSDAYSELIRACDDSRILVESDVDALDHCTARTWAMIKRIAEIKNWQVEDKWEGEGEGIVHRLLQNWQAFERAGYVRPVKKKKKYRK